MTDKHPNGAFVFWSAWLLVFAASCAWGQQKADSRHTGVPQDWTYNQVIYSRSGLARHPEILNLEPRILHHELLESQARHSQALRPGSAPSDLAASAPGQRDWNFDLGIGRLAANMFPAKYSLNPALPPSCANDYVVYGLNTTGVTGGQANLVAFNNIYSVAGSEHCIPTPAVMFAYNITTSSGGRIRTSPALSLDGSKIAFVESATTSTIFHVIKWTAGQGTTITGAAAPPASPDFVSITVSSTATSTRSSPFVDYNTDNAFLGTDDGLMYKILNVFNGTPTLAGPPWPVKVSPTGQRLTPPVVDSRLGLVMVGSQDGALYSVDATTGATKGIQIGQVPGTNPGIRVSPIVDVTNGTTFAISSNDGTSGVLVQVDNASMKVRSTAQLGIASKSGTPVNLNQPAFSNSYFDNPDNGVIRACGTGPGPTSIEPWQFAFGFTDGTLNASPAFSQKLVDSTAARCTEMTHFFNPNVGAPAGTDFFFFGLTQDCTGPLTDGCVVARSSDDPFNSLPKFPIPGGPSGIVVDNFTAGGESGIYFSGLSTPNTAYKLSQNGLQ